ncbi:transposase [Streptomyces sp. I5]|nr:transposase [Streptomyces sp. I5]
MEPADLDRPKTARPVGEWSTRGGRQNARRSTERPSPPRSVRRRAASDLGGTSPRAGRPDRVTADKTYSSRGFRAYLRQRGMAHTIPEKTDQRRHRLRRGGHGGRPPGFDRETYRRCNTIELCFNRLKGFRGIATGYEKTATSYEAAVSLASFPL